MHLVVRENESRIVSFMTQANNDVQYIDLTAVTVLALVYVPLNLATSIFGMNLSDISGSEENSRHLSKMSKGNS